MNRQQRPKINALPALLFWTAVWYLAAMVMDNPLLLPTPLQVLRCLGDMVVTADFWQTAAVSMFRILLGVACAVGLGTVLAVLTSRSRLLWQYKLPAWKTFFLRDDGP